MPKETIPEDMDAIVLDGFGSADVLKPARRPVPRPGPGEILIRVAAAGVNRPDILQRKGLYTPPPGASDLPGLEVAGRVAALDPGVPGWQIGDRVMALVAGGGYASYCLAPFQQCLAVPDNLDDATAAAFPETFFTVWTNVFERGCLKAGDVILVHGGSSGIGTTAIQLARHFGARVIVTVGSAEKSAACRALGADIAINYKETDFVPAILDATAGKGADLILDMIGGGYINRNLACLAVEGRLVQIAFQQGSKTEIDLAPLMVKRQTITGSTLRPRSVAEKGAIADALRAHVLPLIAQGSVKPLLHATFPLASACDAHRLMESNRHIGKIVLEVGGK